MSTRSSVRWLVGSIMVGVAGFALYRLLAFTPIGYRQVAEVKASEARLAHIAVGIQSYWKDCGRLPASSNWVSCLVTNFGVSGWSGPYVRPDYAVDMWGHPFRYRNAGETGEISSAGRDGIFGTKDDLTTVVCPSTNELLEKRQLSSVTNS